MKLTLGWSQCLKMTRALGSRETFAHKTPHNIADLAFSFERRQPECMRYLERAWLPRESNAVNVVDVLVGTWDAGPFYSQPPHTLGNELAARAAGDTDDCSARGGRRLHD